MPRIADTDRQRRIERVWLWVKRHPDGITEQEVADYTEFERRTVNNYLNELRDVGKIDKEGTLWFPLDFEETRIRSLSLSPEEAYALYLGSRLLVKQHDKRNEPAKPHYSSSPRFSPPTPGSATKSPRRQPNWLNARRAQAISPSSRRWCAAISTASASPFAIAHWAAGPSKRCLTPT